MTIRVVLMILFDYLCEIQILHSNQIDKCFSFKINF